MDAVPDAPSLQLLEAAVQVNVPLLHEALEELGVKSLTQCLAYGASFMGTGACATGEIEELRDNLARKTTDLVAGSTDPCGNCVAMTADQDGSRSVRTLILACRTLHKTVVQTAMAVANVAPPDSAAAAAAEAKPLGEKVLDGHWDAGAAVTGGFSTTEPHYHISDAQFSRIIHANKAGTLWIPGIDATFTYRDASSSKQIKTLLMGASETKTELLLVQGAAANERHDEMTMVCDYLDLLRHRSCAMVAAYSTAEASAAFLASDRFGKLTCHDRGQVTGTTRQCMLTPHFISMLERRLIKSARSGYSVSQMIRIDKQVVQAILERASLMFKDGNLAVEYICDSCMSLFSLESPEITPSPPESSSARSDGEDERQRRRTMDHIRQLTSERDRARNACRERGSPIRNDRREDRRENRRDDRAAAANDKPMPSRNDDRRNDDRRGERRDEGAVTDRICNDYNRSSGCSRGSACRYLHICNKQRPDGGACRQKHSATSH
jgi:hypothetical protein